MSLTKVKQSTRFVAAVTMLVILSVFFTHIPLYAEDYYWFGGVGSWEDPANWSPSGIPGTSDNVWVTNSPGTTGNVLLNTNVTVKSLSLYSTGSETMNMNLFSILSADQVSVNGDVSLYLRYGVIGTVNQTGGYVFGTLGLQVPGTYNLHAGMLSSGEVEFSVSGVLNQTGGRTFGDELYVRGGVYNLSGTGQAVFTHNPSEVGTGGTFNQDGGQAGLRAVSVQGTYNLTGGSLRAGTEGLWANNINGGTFNQSGGTVSFGGYMSPAGIGLYVGYAFGDVSTKTAGTYNLSGGRLEANGIVVGDRFNYSGGELVLGQKVNESWVMGTLTNNGTTSLSGTGTRVMDGNVINNGTFKTTHTTAVYTGTFTNNGAYISDRATQYFNDLIVGQNGYIAGSVFDRFYISGDFINNSNMNTDWNTMNSYLGFVDGTDSMHDFYLTGLDYGTNLYGYRNNFSWDALDLTGNFLRLYDGNDVAGGALYLDDILGLEIQDHLITNITGKDGLNIYYLAGLSDNSYLHGLEYDLECGGHLIPVGTSPVPEPPTMLLLCSGFMILVGFRKRFRT